MIASPKYSEAFGYSIDMKETIDVYSFGVEDTKVEAKLIMEEKSVIMEDWDDT